MQHRYSKSTKVLPKSNSILQQISASHIKDSSVRLPSIINKKNSLQSLSNLSAMTLKSKKTKKTMETIDPIALQIIQKIKQKSKLLAMLKQKILECNDNLFVKKVLNQIKFTSIGKIAIQMWNNVQLFENCDIVLLQKIHQAYEFTFTDDSLKTMDFINNVCRFLLADYKKKRWLDKQKQINSKISMIGESMIQVGKRAVGIQLPQTKMEIISSLAGIKQECYAKKQLYLDWKSRATEKLKQNNIKCDILRAEIFTENFF